jgi:hypothetical protein
MAGAILIGCSFCIFITALYVSSMRAHSLGLKRAHGLGHAPLKLGNLALFGSHGGCLARAPLALLPHAVDRILRVIGRDEQLLVQRAHKGGIIGAAAQSRVALCERALGGGALALGLVGLLRQVEIQERKKPTKLGYQDATRERLRPQDLSHALGLPCREPRE